MFKAREIKPGIHWVGALEWEERYIHGITMPLGSTNNAYLIMDEKIVLVDTCVGPHAHELLERVSSVVDPARIDYIVSNHGEKDHAGSIGEVLAAAPNATVVTSDPKGLAILKTYLPEGTSFLPMKSGDTLSIGARTLQFVHTPMVHSCSRTTPSGSSSPPASASTTRCTWTRSCRARRSTSPTSSRRTRSRPPRRWRPCARSTWS